MTRQPINSRGFSIVELVVAISVLGIFVIGLTTVLSNLQILNNRAKDLSVANGLAEKKIEALRSADYVALSNDTVDFVDELPDTLGSPRTAVYVVSTVNASLKKVAVTITYNESGNQRTIDYATFIGELGVGQQ